MDVGEENKDPSPFIIHTHNIVISNENKDLGAMGVEVCHKTHTIKQVGTKYYALGGLSYNKYLKLQIKATKLQETSKFST